MMMVSIGGCSACLIIITIVLLQSANTTSKTIKKSLGWAAVTFFFIFYACFGIRAVGIPWLYPTEINPLGIRQKGSALAMATNWIVCYMCVQVTPIGIANLGWKFWIPWAAFCGCFVPFTYLFYPETARRTLEDIDKLFDNGLPLVVRQKTTVQLKQPQEFINADLELSRFEDKKLGLGENAENVETA
jgi:Sugar (and other) transporter